MDFRPVLYLLGIFLVTLAAAMSVPLLVEVYYDSPHWTAFFRAILITGFFGGILLLTNTMEKFQISVRQGFLITTLSWVALAFFGALPFYFSDRGMSFTDSFFESMSGVTTTGSTVMQGLDFAPKGILIWRALLQWLGGIGIIVMALSVLPFLKVGGMQLFRMESSEHEKALPRTARLASAIGIIYVGLTALCALGYGFAGMGAFDSVAHAMTTLATGGFSTSDQSFSDYERPWIEIVAIVFMFMGGLPFVLYLRAVRGDIFAIFRDSQVRVFSGIVCVSIFVLVLYLTGQQDMPFWDSLRRASFNTISVITGTGYGSADYNAWGGFVVAMMFFLMVVGGCAGSTSCGIKIFRFQVLQAVTVVQIRQILNPRGIFIPHYNHRPLPKGVSTAVMSFFFLYALCFSLLTIALSFVGLDFLTAMSGAATAISNVGPGLGDIIGPTGTFASLPDSAKWLLSGGMLLGRLELFTVLVLLTPGFWRS